MKASHLVLALVFLAITATASAEVIRVDIERRHEVAGGEAYGLAGSYERVAGRIHYAVTPQNPINRIITDIEYAPTDAAGLVEFSADFVLIKPTDIEAGNGAVFFEVANRGRIGALARFNRAVGSQDPVSPEHFGDGFLLRQGFTLLWVGWQHDTPLQEGLLRAYPPAAAAAGEPIEGLVRSDVFVEEKILASSLGDRGHASYPVSDPADPRNVLMVRDGLYGERRRIPREDWQFARVEGGRVVADPTSVYLHAGFEPGRVYDVVYVSEAPPLAGLGLAAVRDAISLFKYGDAESLGIPRGALDRAIGYGSSQSGRLLRTYLYDGFNEDEQGRKVFDGVIAHIAGAARGSFNQRFAQPSRAPGGAFDYPNRLFPFADAEQTDPVTGRSDGLLANISDASMPKIFYTNSSTEYWRSVAALAHTTVDGKRDLSLPENVRSYHFSGTQHGPAPFPPSSGRGEHLPNPNDYTWFLRSLVLEMDRWIADEAPPPPSRISTLDDGTLVTVEELAFPDVPGVGVLSEVNRLLALDFGSDLASRGVVTQEPPTLGAAYPFLVPQVDEGGNEIGGLRSPDISVPLGTYTGWLPTNPVSGVGVYAPFPRTMAERKAGGDPRLSIEERYAGRAHFLGLVAQAALPLIHEGYLLGEDLPEILGAAANHWDYLVDGDAVRD